MNRYDPNTPRLAFAISAAAWTALTIGLFVIAPAGMDSTGPESTVLAVKKETTAEPTDVVINPSRIDVVGEPEKKVAMAEEASASGTQTAREVLLAVRQGSPRASNR